MQKAIFIGVAVLLCASSAVATDCSTIQACQPCVAAVDCGWCAATQLCYAADDKGQPKAPNKCVLSWEYSECEDCQGKADSCYLCNQYDDCKWCQSANGGAGGCRPLSFADEGCAGLVSHSCPCNQYKTCSGCAFGSGGECVWCKNSGQCEPKGMQPAECLVDPSCVPSEAECASNVDCGSCRGMEGCNWCSGEGGSKCVVGTICPANEALKFSCEKSCLSYSNCADCDTHPGCSWCYMNQNDVQQCNSNGNLGVCDRVVLTCDADLSGGFRAGDFVGGMFFVILLIVIGFGLLAFYRWRQGKPIYNTIS